MIIYVKLRHSKMYNFKIVVNIKNLCVWGGTNTSSARKINSSIKTDLD